MPIHRRYAELKQELYEVKKERGRYRRALSKIQDEERYVYFADHEECREHLTPGLKHHYVRYGRNGTPPKGHSDISESPFMALKASYFEDLRRERPRDCRGLPDVYFGMR